MAGLAALDKIILQLEGSLNLAPGAVPAAAAPAAAAPAAPAPAAVVQEEPKAGSEEPKEAKPKKEKKPKAPPKAKASKAPAPPPGHPTICQIEFKVGVITKVWRHPDADKLWCEEIDCGEASPRQISSGLVPYYTEEQMLGHRLLVVANLKARNLKGFKSHGMVLCAKSDDGARVQFIEPPAAAPLGEVVRYEGMPDVVPASGAQVDKKKMFQEIAEGMKTNERFEGTWDGHVFMTSEGPCKCVDIAGGQMS
jgi:methionine--tRNA ligase beta chain